MQGAGLCPPDICRALPLGFCPAPTLASAKLRRAAPPLGLGTFAAGNVIGTDPTLVATPRPAAWRTRLLGLDCGEQLLHGALRRRTERFVQMNRLCKLLADEVIALREFGVAGFWRTPRRRNRARP